MAMSQFETLSRVTALLFSAALSSACLAAQDNEIGSLKTDLRQSSTGLVVTANDFDQRISKVLSAKNSQLRKESTVDSKTFKALNRAQSLQIENIKAIGGSSDGGGNAVGRTLFDFYENQGSIEITIDELIALEPNELQMIDFLNQQVPAMDYLESGGFGTQIKKTLGFKKIYLEPKAIGSQSCLNESMVSTDQQTIIACQSDEELRIDLKWMKETDSKNRAGLINHELILAWARIIEENQTKEIIERHVRELNRISFAALLGNSPREQMSDTISRLFGVRTFSAKNYAIAVSLKEKMKIAMDGFCQNIDYDITSLFHDLWGNEFLMTDDKLVPQILISMKMISESARNGNDRKSLAQDQEDLCWKHRLDKTPIHRPVLKTIPADCLDRIASIANATANVGKSPQLFSQVEVDYYRRETLIKAISESKLCSRSKYPIKSKEIFYEALNYYRYLLAQQGIEMSFQE